jgi:hypothetical protein
VSENHKNTLKTAWNDVTGDNIRTGKGSQDKFSSGWELIWAKNKAQNTWKDNPPSNPLEQSCYDEGMSFEDYLDWIGEQSR